ncbi:MAG: hypothetical protein M1822_007389 [Bathelium mastoideum]|nr:MAG: hypothetical protein M1822_007389 [Bathelium mastoideum]
MNGSNKGVSEPISSAQCLRAQTGKGAGEVEWGRARTQRSDSIQWNRKRVLACLLSLATTADGSRSHESNLPKRDRQLGDDLVNEFSHTILQAQNVSCPFDRVIAWAPSVSFFCICLAAGVIATCYASIYSQNVERYYLRAAVVSAYIHVSIVASSETSFLVQLSLGLLDLYFGLRYTFEDRKLRRLGVNYGLWVVTTSITIDAFLAKYISSGSKDRPASLFATWLIPATIFSLVACEMFVDKFVRGLRWLVPELQRVIDALAEPDQ